jgi:hypothetical protein
MFVRLRLSVSVLCLTLLSLLAPSALRASNLVLNNDFSSGSTDWNSSSWAFGDKGPFNGNTNYADTGCVGSGCISGGTASGAYLYQDLTTVAGDSYTLSFEYYSGNEGGYDELVALFGSTQGFDIVNPDDSGYNLYSVSGLLATSTSTELTFLGRQDPTYDRLTEVSVTDDGPATVTPEPSSLYLLGSGLVALGGLVRRKLKA